MTTHREIQLTRLLPYASNPPKYTNLKGLSTTAITTAKLLGLQTKCAYLTELTKIRNYTVQLSNLTLTISQGSSDVSFRSPHRRGQHRIIINAGKTLRK